MWFCSFAEEIRTIGIAVKQLARERLGHHASLCIAIDRQADQCSPDRQTRDERAGAINRVDHPDMTAIDIFRAIFFAKNAVIWKLAPDDCTNRAFRSTVGFRDRIKSRSVFVVDLVELAKPWQGFSSCDRSDFGKKCLINQQSQSPVSIR